MQNVVVLVVKNRVVQFPQTKLVLRSIKEFFLILAEYSFLVISWTIGMIWLILEKITDDEI